ncbi:MAG TPA: DUF2914 domain-containing protein [Polyangia bacterium]|jgi:hypothetical protein
MGDLQLPVPGEVPAATPTPPAPATPGPLTALRERLALVPWRKVLEQLMPAIALGLGILSQTYAKHTVAFAPKAVALLVVAWALAAGIGEWLPEVKPEERYARLRNFLRKAAATVTVGMFRNVLFFLVPIWFGSSTLGSFNMLAPIVLAAVALFACFPNKFRQTMLERPHIRTLYCSSVLFVALVPAAAVEIGASPRLSAALAAGVAWLASSLATSRVPLTTRVGRIELGGGTLVAALLCAFAAPILPPVPVACTEAAIGTGLHNREIEGVAERFPAGTKRIYAWFAVHVPSRYRQGIRFEWYRDGERVGNVSAREIIGGREHGYRTSSSMPSPKPGSWRVDLLTDASQLIARKSFIVE